MKKLSIEQKARAYDEAIERAKIYYSTTDSAADTELIELLFPELKESEEDEKIRKELLQIAKESEDSFYMVMTPGKRKHLINWLEKQGEKKPAVDTKVVIPKFRVGDIVKSKSQPMLSPRKIISIGKDCYRCEDRGCIGFAWEDDYEIVEQKPAWSEEDETGLMNTIIMLKEGASLHFNKKDITKAVDWLKLLRDRVQPQPKQGWSEEDDAKLKSILFHIEDVENKDVIDWLKSLKDRVQPKQEILEKLEEWLDEYVSDLADVDTSTLICSFTNYLDGKLPKSFRPQNSSVTDEELAQAKRDAYNDALDKIEYHSGEPTFDDGWCAAIWYLKKRNTTPQSQWKPSEGQLECLGYAIEKAEKDWSPLTNNRVYLTLKALKEQLLELKGSKV